MAEKKSPVSDFLWANWLKLLLTIVLLAVVAGMGYLMTFEKQTKLEAALEAIILTAASIAASFLMTKVYAEVGYSAQPPASETRVPATTAARNADGGSTPTRV